MKIVVLSDTHIPASSDTLPEIVKEELKDADMIIHAGDLSEPSVYEELKNIAPVEAVVGNMDAHKLRRELPEKKILQIKNFRIGLVHGDGPPDNIINYVRGRFANEKLDCIIYGHSHDPKIETIDNTIYFNPGSPTDEIFAPYKSFGILEVNDKLTPKIIKV